ncbi:MAG TPA: hypothetical protein VGE14_04260 [Marmoricola sp.]
MTEMRGALHGQGPWEDGDVDRVVRLLRDCGPLPLDALGQESALADWPAQRVQQAVVSAWSHNLIYVDASDLLVAL